METAAVPDNMTPLEGQPAAMAHPASARVRAAVAWLAWALVSWGFAGCDFTPPGKPDPADRPQTPAEITDFQALFEQNCTGCHGAGGTLGPAPPLNDSIFLAIVPDDVLIDVVTNGRAGTPMPAFARHNEGTLTDQQIRIITEGLKQHWKSDKLPEVKLPEYVIVSSTEPASAAAVERGEKLFARACAGCHGKAGAGSGAGSLNDPAVLALISNQALRRIIITGRADLGMPNFAGRRGRPGDFQPLTSEEIEDLVALLASWRRSAATPETTTAKVP